MASLGLPAHATDFVVVVHKDNPVDGLTSQKLARVFKAEMQEWSPRESIVLLLPKAGTPEKGVLLERVYGMQEAELKRHWTQLIYRNRISEPPRALPSAAVTLQVVAKTRGAIALIRASEFDAKLPIKALAIDDKIAGEPGYALSDGQQTDHADRGARRATRDAGFARDDEPEVQDPPSGVQSLEERVAALESLLADQALAEEADSGLPNLSLRGFGHVHFAAEQVDPESGPDSVSDSFALGGLDLFLTSRLSERISFLNETVLEATEDNETVLDVERLSLSYRHSDALNLQVGRFHTTLGWWNENFHHGEWLQTSIGRPQVLDFEDEDGVLPVHMVGIVLKGRHDADAAALEYTIELGNGRGPTPDPPQTVTDANDGKAVNFALQVSPAALAGLSLGGAIYLDDIPSNGDPGAGPLHGQLDETIANAFVVWRHGTWRLAAEYFAIEHDGAAEAESSGWYSELAWGCGAWTPYVRVEGLEIDDADPYYTSVDDQSTLSAGVRWDVSTWNAVKLQGNWTDVGAGPGGVDEQRSSIVLQTAFAF